ncbi:MAG: hypothetical protein ACJ8IQ_04465 [Chthoniobacterales bacterium]
MHRDINLDGGEITILKTLGLTGAQMSGKNLIEKSGEMETAEFLDTLSGLMSLGYVLSDKVNIRLIEEVERASFRVNPSYSRDLKGALHPGQRRNEERERRERRR